MTAVPLPVSWQLVPVREAGEVRLGRQRSPLHQSGRFTTPYLRVANVFDGWIDYSDVLSMDFTPAERRLYGLLPNDILLNEGQSLELVGRSAVYEGEPGAYCFQNTLIRFRCKETTLPGYCRAVFKFWLDTGRFAQVARQTTSVAHLGADRFAEMMFPRPSVEEQHRIADILDAADAEIRQTEAVIAKLRQMKAGLLHGFLTRGLDEQGRLRDPSACPEQFKDSSLGQIPREWEACPFGDTVDDWAVGPRFSADLYNPGGNVATLRTTDLDEEGKLSLDTMPLARVPLAGFQGHLLQTGDLVVSRSGTCGIAAVFPGHSFPVLPGAFLLRFRLNRRLLPHYARYLFNFGPLQQRVQREAEGAVQKNLRGTSLLPLLVPIPTVPEQEGVLQQMAFIESQTDAEITYRDKLKLQKRGLMHDLLTGRVTCDNEEKPHEHRRRVYPG
jgi:type I restriction enzyme S subunit